MLLTFSFDDGYEADLRVARLLNKYKLKGTFYPLVENIINYKNLDYRLYYLRLCSPEMLKEISKNHEIGSHTLKHKRLDMLSNEEIRQTLMYSKKFLENILQCNIETARDTKKINIQIDPRKPKIEVKMLCYPRGVYTEDVKKIARECGYTGARSTVEPRSTEVLLDTPIDPFSLTPTCHFYSHNDEEGEAGRILSYFKQNPKVFHLYGHSYMYDDKDFEILEEILANISPNNQAVTNSELVDILFKDD